MGEILPFFIVLAAGLLLSEIFYSLKLPWVVALMAAGIIIGPHGLGFVEHTPTLDFLAQIGLVFLMFMAGLEVKLSSFKENKKEVVLLSIINGVIPFLVGVQIGLIFGYNITASLLLGTVFISSSIAVIIPALSRNDLLRAKFGKAILSSTMVEDILSLILLSIIIQTNADIASIPLPIFYILVVITLLGLRWIVHHFHQHFPKYLLIFAKKHNHGDLFQQNLRLLITVLMGTVILFEILGLHPIIAGFFAGLILSERVNSEKLKEKMRVISYGIFIPIFFVVTGLQTDLANLLSSQEALILAIAVTTVAMLSKFLGGLAGGLFSNFTFTQSALVGVSTMPRLTTALAVAFAGSEFGLFDEKLVTALVLLSLISALLSPILMSQIIKHLGTK